jgi:antitoxin HicB
MKNMLAYPVTIEKDGKFLLADCPDIRAAHTQGKTLKEALEMAEDVLKDAIGVYFDNGEPVPLPSKPKIGQQVVVLPLSVSAKILLWNEMIHQRVTG